MVSVGHHTLRPSPVLTPPSSPQPPQASQSLRGSLVPNLKEKSFKEINKNSSGQNTRFAVHLHKGITIINFLQTFFSSQLYCGKIYTPQMPSF